jgi:hypothetical protein
MGKKTGQEILSEAALSTKPAIVVKITVPRQNFMRYCQVEIGHTQEIYVTVAEGQPVKVKKGTKELRFDASFDAPSVTEVITTDNWVRFWHWVDNVFPDGLFGTTIVKGEPTRLLERYRKLRFDRPFPSCYDPYLGDDGDRNETKDP